MAFPAGLPPPPGLDNLPPPPDAGDDELPPFPDLDDGQDDEDQWVEFKNAKGETLQYNTTTRDVRLPDDDVEKNDTLQKMPGMSHKEFKKTRRNSTILAMTATNGMQLPPVPDKKSEDYVLERVVNDLAKTVRLCEMVLNQESLLSQELADDLERINSRVREVHASLEDGVLELDDRTDIEALLELGKHRWDFENDHVAHYRAEAKYHGHDEVMPFEDWHVPEYFSDFPLPADAKEAQCVVRLPVSEHTHTGIQLTEKDCVAKAISQAFAKMKGAKNAGKESDYVLKANGLNQYMRGEKLLYSYAYVRRCLRDQLKVKLSLVKRPEAFIEDESSQNRDYYESVMKPDPKLIMDKTYQELEVAPWDRLESIPLQEMGIPFRVRIIGVDNLDLKTIPRLQDYNLQNIYIETFLYHGVHKMEETRCLTEMVEPEHSPRWYMWAGSDVVLNTLPRGGRVGFILWGETVDDNQQVRLGWVAKQLIDHYGALTSGYMDLPMWAFPAKKKGKHKAREVDPDFIYRATNRPNLADKNPCVLKLQFDDYMVPVVEPLEPKFVEPNLRVVGVKVSMKTLSSKQRGEFDRLCGADPLYALTEADKQLLWLTRHHLVTQPMALPKFLQSVHWGNKDCMHEAHRLLRLWAPPFNMVSVLELLDAKYPDYKVRKYAVNCLRRLQDDELQMYLLQLTQCLKFEPYHSSVLSNFMIQRALRSPYVIGHHFFWHLKAELHDPPFAERFGLILEEYLAHAGRFAAELRKQNMAVLRMQRVAALIVRLKREEGKDDEVATQAYKEELEKLNRKFFRPMGKFQIPLDPKWEATTLIVEKCRYMSSKMVPLWLVFRNADEEADPIFIMFKSGDDLRQDILTLQMLRIMDKLWLASEEKLDMRLKPYKCIATGVNAHMDGVGMIEIVLNSDTTSGIQLKYGGGAMGALKMDPIRLFLEAHNTTDKVIRTAVENFTRSCAGYCVATFVMGIGDRHNGNIMVTEDGHLFHIDFGHFLGNFKKKFGVNRERAAFVLTPEMGFAMGGKNYKKSKQFKDFRTLCSKAYKVLRQNAQILETLFILMAAAGMPELMVESDVDYLKEKLHLSLKWSKAEKHFQDEVDKSLDTNFRRFDNMIHNFKHGG